MVSEFEAMQRIASVWDHEAVYILAKAAEATAAAHRVHGVARPELREEAERLERMAELLKNTNRMRSQLPEVPQVQSGGPKRRPVRRPRDVPSGPQWPVPMLGRFGSMSAARSRASAVARKLKATGITTYQPSKSVREGVRCEGHQIDGTVQVSVDVEMPGQRRRVGLGVAEALADQGFYFEVRHDDVLTNFTIHYPDEEQLPEREPYKLADCPICGRNVALRPDGKWFRLPNHDPTKDSAERCRASGHTIEHAEWMKTLDLSMLEAKGNG